MLDSVEVARSLLLAVTVVLVSVTVAATLELVLPIIAVITGLC